MISNISSNHTIIGTINDIASLAYYPLLLLILTFLPIIVLIILLIIKVSNKTKILVLFFNIIYSLLLPVIVAAIITDFELKSYVYGIILNDSFIISAFNNIRAILIPIYYLAGLFMLAYLVMNATVILVIYLSNKIINTKIINNKIINIIKIIGEIIINRFKSKKNKT